MFSAILDTCDDLGTSEGGPVDVGLDESLADGSESNRASAVVSRLLIRGSISHDSSLSVSRPPSAGINGTSTASFNINGNEE